MIILIIGRSKTGKTRLARILAGILEARLVDSNDPSEADKALLGQVPQGPLVVTIPTSKGLPPSAGSIRKEAVADLVIEMPSMKVIKDRRNTIGVPQS